MRNGVGAKRNIGPAGYTLIDAPMAGSLNVFEGVFDFLSALEYYGQQTPTFPTLILNSTTNLESAFPLLESYQRVNAYLDNDTAEKATLERLFNNGLCVANRSKMYAEHKDFNELWLERPTFHLPG